MTQGFTGRAAKAKGQTVRPRDADQKRDVPLALLFGKKEVNPMPGIDDSDLKRLVEARLRRHRLKTYGKL
jgi:hypothetical protein